MRFVPNDSGEKGGYDRTPKVYVRWDDPAPKWAWVLGLESWESLPNPLPRVRMRVRTSANPTTWVPVGDWLQPTTNNFLLPLPVAAGQYSAKPEVDLPGVVVFEKPVTIVVNGQAPGYPWDATVLFEEVYGIHRLDAQCLPFTGLPVPKVWPLKPRVIEQYSTLLPKTEQYVRRIQANHSARLTRRWTVIPSKKAPVAGDPGIVCIEGDQKYKYSQATSLGNPATFGREAPVICLRDGERGFGSLGTIYTGVVRRGGKGYYLMDTQGRLVLMTIAGKIITEAGWRVKPGRLKAHGGMRSVFYPYLNNAAHKAFYEDTYEYIGDTSRLVGPEKKWREAWDMLVAMRLPDGTTDKRDGHEFWVTDTLNHRITFVDHWTAHDQAHYQKAHFPPLGYVPPEGPTGQSTFFDFVRTANGLPDEFLNGPWGIDELDSKIYWSNFDGHSLSRANMDGSGKEVVLNSSIKPTWADLQTQGNERLGSAQSVANVNRIRSLYLKDGPIGVASCVCPQAIRFTSEKKLIFVERYTYALRELDLVAGMVRTLALLPNLMFGGTSSATTDFAMAIDVEGTCGPKDDIYLAGWHEADHQYSKDGVYRGRWAWTSGAHGNNGPLNTANSPSYAWAPVIGDGKKLQIGNAAGWQCVEITKRQPQDMTVDTVKWERGAQAYRSSTMALLHGPEGQGELGLPTIDDFGSWDATTLDAYATQHQVPAADLEAFRYYVEVETKDIDYSQAPPVPIDCVKELDRIEPKPGPEGEWTACVNGKQTRVMVRYFNVVTPPANGGAACGPLEEEFTEEQDCLSCEEQLAAAQALIVELRAQIATLQAQIAEAVEDLSQEDHRTRAAGFQP